MSRAARSFATSDHQSHTRGEYENAINEKTRVLDPRESFELKVTGFTR